MIIINLLRKILTHKKQQALSVGDYSTQIKESLGLGNGFVGFFKECCCW